MRRRSTLPFCIFVFFSLTLFKSTYIVASKNTDIENPTNQTSYKSVNPNIKISDANKITSPTIPLTQAERDWIAQHPIIRLGVDPEFSPFEFIENNEYFGMTADYIKLLSESLRLNLVIEKNLSWKEVTTKARLRELDVLPAVGITEDRSRYFNFTQSYLSFHRVIVSRIEQPFLSGLEDLNKFSVAVQENSSHHGFLRENTQVSPMPYPSLIASLLAVSGGNADLFVGNVASATYWIRKLNLTNLKVAAPVSSKVQSLHFAVRRTATYDKLKGTSKNSDFFLRSRKHRADDCKDAGGRAVERRRMLKPRTAVTVPFGYYEE